MMKIFVSVILAALTIPAIALGQTYPSASPQAAPQPIASGNMQAGGSVPLIPANKKGPSGTATLAQQGGDLVVTLQLPSGYAATGAAAIYNGSCKSTGQAAPKGKALFTLTAADTNGTSKTTIPKTTVEMLVGHPHVLVVQGTPQLCGDIANLLPPQKP
jgi:hypothetical protein